MGGIAVVAGRGGGRPFYNPAVKYIERFLTAMRPPHRHPPLPMPSGPTAGPPA